MTNGDVDALHAIALLVQDRVNGDGGLTGLTVADDEFALATANWGHGVNSLNTSLEWLAYRLASSDTRGLNFHTTLFGANQWALAVDWLAQCVHHATEQCVTNGHRQDPSGGLYDLLFFDAINGTENYRTNGLFVEVHRETYGAVFELEEFVHLG